MVRTVLLLCIYLGDFHLSATINPEEENFSDSQESVLGKVNFFPWGLSRLSITEFIN